MLKKRELIVFNKIDLIDEDTAKDVIDDFSKDKNCEIMTMTTLNKESVSKIKAKLLPVVGYKHAKKAFHQWKLYFRLL